MWNKSKTAGLGAFILPAVYYLYNGYPGLGFIDSGELALCSQTMGVAHPTGYPLYTLISRIFTLFGTRPIEAVSFCAALTAAGAVSLFYFTLVAVKSVLLENCDRHNLIPLTASLVLALAPVISEQGVINEVYGLGLFLNLAVFYVALIFLKSDDADKAGRYFLLTWFLAGLSLTNHLNSIQLLPGLIILSILYLRKYRAYRTALLAPILFLIPLTVYLSLPIRSQMILPPVADWGDVTSFDNFYRHISGWQFRVWFFSSDAATVWSNFNNFLGIIKAQYPWPLLILFPIGLWKLENRLPGLLYFALTSMLVNIGLGVNYGIPDISGYYLMSIALILFLIASGFYYLTHLLKSRPQKIWAFLPILGVIIFGWQIYLTTPQNYKGDYYLPEDFALNIGRSADYNGMIITEIWDHHSQLFYLQQAEQFRPDLKLIDKELLRRSWYYKNLKNIYPKLYATIDDLVGPFLKELEVFEAGGNFNPTRLENYYQMIINRIIIENQPAFVDFRLKYRPQGEQYQKAQGLLYRIELSRPDTIRHKPDLLWRGKLLTQYKSLQEINHVRNIMQMLAQ